MADAPEAAVYVDGKPYTLDDLTFRELRDVRQIVRDLTGNPEAGIWEGDDIDFFPALVTVLKRRDDPAFRVEDAEALTALDLQKPKGNGRPPTKRPKTSP